MRRSNPPAESVDADPKRPGGTAHEPASPPAPDPVERAELGRALEIALAGLRPDQRAAIVLRYEHGLSFGDIGIVLGVPEATARSHVHRARKALAERLTAAGWAPPR